MNKTISIVKSTTQVGSTVELFLKTVSSTYNKDLRISKIVVQMYVTISKGAINWHDSTSGSYIKISEVGQGGKNGWLVNSKGEDLSGSSQTLYFDGSTGYLDKKAKKGKKNNATQAYDLSSDRFKEIEKRMRAQIDKNEQKN